MFKVIVWLIVLCDQFCGKPIQNPSPPCTLSAIHASFQYKYYQEGDVIIGGLFTVNDALRWKVYYHFLHKRLICVAPSTRQYVGFMTFIFAINEINQDPYLLPNVSLGYHIYDTCGDEIKSFQNILQILSDETEAPNYSCRKHGEVAGFVGHSLEQAQFLHIYGYPMVSHMVTAPPPRKNNFIKSFSTAQHNTMAIMEAVILYLKHFGWNSVGLITSTDLYGEIELMEMVEYFKKEGICFEYIIISPDIHTRPLQEKVKLIKNSVSRVVIVACPIRNEIFNLLQLSEFIRKYITLLILDMWPYEKLLSSLTLVEACNCSISFSYKGNIIPGLETFFSTDIAKAPMDPLLEDIWYYAVYCNISNEYRLRIQQYVNNFPLRNCTGQNFYIPNQLVGTYVAYSYHVYSAVYSLAHALHDMYMFGNEKDKESRSLQYRTKVIIKSNK